MKELEIILKSTAKISDEKAAVVSIFHIHNIFKDALLTELKTYDLSIEQYNVLRILRGQKGQPINLQDIQERMINKMSNTTRLVDKLLKKDFVNRIICKNNRRKVEISITRHGLKILQELDPKIDATETRVTSNLKKEELKQLNNLLLKLNN
ncbi:MarR family winged helix-turn-helix transcriptional regulator [Winogradskyella litorisediminis]|uniref:MarR family winged helix-turn-helix transcriptional regulator n=1 Tax=Winogradskyella litorisediminis TaxID=1156618 RepID=A0ABW3N7J3_9FLAO